MELKQLKLKNYEKDKHIFGLLGTPLCFLRKGGFEGNVSKSRHNHYQG